LGTPGFRLPDAEDAKGTQRTQKGPRELGRP
jgi:hypothetical protein